MAFRTCLPAAILGLLLAAGVGAQDEGIRLRRGFREIVLGSDFDTTEAAIVGDTAFAYRGRPDISLSLSREDTVIDTRGRGYVDRGLFAFHDDRLFSISLYLRQRRIDYFQVFNQLSERYGDPTTLDPERAIWENGETRIELERPLTVRFLDLAVFRARRDETRSYHAVEDITREDFLDEF